MWCVESVCFVLRRGLGALRFFRRAEYPGVGLGRVNAGIRGFGFCGCFRGALLACVSAALAGRAGRMDPGAGLVSAHTSWC